MNQFKNILKSLRLSNNLTQQQLADKLGVKQNTISMYENGLRTPDLSFVGEIADFFNTDINYLINGKGTVSIPVLGDVVAGVPADAVEYTQGYEEISQDLASKGEFFALKIKGDSMEPRILNGDIVIVKKQPDVNNGDIAIVLISGNEATCKVVEKNKDGITLVPLNNLKYKNINFSNEEIEKMPITILGKVVELRARF